MICAVYGGGDTNGDNRMPGLQQGTGREAVHQLPALQPALCTCTLQLHKDRHGAMRKQDSKNPKRERLLHTLGRKAHREMKGGQA